MKGFHFSWKLTAEPTVSWSLAEGAATGVGDKRLFYPRYSKQDEPYVCIGASSPCPHHVHRAEVQVTTGASEHAASLSHSWRIQSWGSLNLS